MEFISDATNYFCKKLELEKNRYYFSLILPCARLKSTVNLNVELLNHNNKFEIGLHFFQSVAVTFTSDRLFETSAKPGVSKLFYTWSSNKMSVHNHVYYKKKYLVLNFVENYYRWATPIAKCKEYGMALPHL